MLLIPNKTRLKFVYTPASPGFSQQANIAMSFKSIPDIAGDSIKDAIKIVVDESMSALEPYSRYLARNPDGANEFEGLILLPPYLWPITLRQVLHGLEITCPLPPHRPQVVDTEKNPCECLTCPEPAQSGQV